MSCVSLCMRTSYIPPLSEFTMSIKLGASLGNERVPHWFVPPGYTKQEPEKEVASSIIALDKATARS